VCKSQLGSGGFGIVHVWSNPSTGQVFALKKCKFGSELVLTSRHKDAWVREVDIMLRLNHPGVVSCVPTPPGLDPGTPDLPTLCMEYCEQGDLRRELNKPESCRGVPEHQVLAILNDITSALGYLHNRRIIHRDLKPENVVLKKTESRTVYKLIDLGYAKELGVSSMAQSFVGTLQYVAPELFLGHDYTKSVDYWSLGLLCHEVVTGQRPFLPNMSPGQWIDYVESKKYEDISVVQSIEGEIQYRTHLALETQVSRPLAERLEEWLRTLLDWRAESRGKDSNTEVVTVFTQLDNILRERRLCVVNTDQGCVSHITVGEGDTYHTILSHLARVTHTTQDKLVLITTTGESVSHSQPVTHQHLFLFSLVERPVQHYLQQPLHVPELVTHALKDARRTVQDYHQKKMFVHGYHFINDQYKILQNLKKGLKALHKYLTDRVKEISEESVKLNSRKEKMTARFDLFKESHQHDKARYQEQASRKDRITSKKMVDHWDKTERDLYQITEEVGSRTLLVQETLTDVEKRLVEAEEVTSEPVEDPELQVLVDKSLAVYSSLRRDRSDYSARQIAQLVVRMLRRREVVRSGVYTHLVTLTQCLQIITDLAMAVRILDKDITQADTGITRAQTRRQSDVWTLLAAAVKANPARHQDQTARADPAETDRIIQENEAVRRRLDSQTVNWDSILD